jgi:acyl-CoA thioesterase-1
MMSGGMKRKIALLAALAMLGCARADEPPPRAQQPAAPVAQRDQRGVILFLGTSLTAGYGVGVSNAFPALIQQKLDSAALPFRVVNAGLSGETSAGGLRRLDWSLQQPIDVLVLELGANDGLRGLPVDQMRANLDSIITRTKRRYPGATVIVAGMQAPTNLGAAYTSQFRDTFRDLARKHHAVLIPFLLEGVATIPSLNQEDGIHPNVQGHRLIAGTIWRSLEPARLQHRSPLSSPLPAATR